jgi:hypothetical protein
VNLGVEFPLFFYITFGTVKNMELWGIKVIIANVDF